MFQVYYAYKIFLLFFTVGRVFCSSDDINGWNYLNLHCRNNENSPIDWWILYKPPSDADTCWESGRNFTYITSKNSGKWQASNKYIASSSMLQHTISPLNRLTYSDYIAILAYESEEKKTSFPGTVQGIMLADDVGGLFIGHTVPGLTSLILDNMPFPDEEMDKGHMIMCLSLNLDKLNKIAKLIKLLQPKILRIQVHEKIINRLPNWQKFYEPNNFNISAIQLDFRTKGDTVRAVMIARSPGNHSCLYNAFAKKNKIVLDVYGHAMLKTVCEKEYSVRKVDAISLKFPDNIYYINNEFDRFGFGVSTAAHWQRSGSLKSQYWVCTGSFEKDDFSDEGEFILCLEDYHIWRSFDMLKIKEPNC